MADNDPQPKSVRRTIRRRAERTVAHNLAIQHLRQRLQRGDADSSDSSGNVDSDNESEQSAGNEEDEVLLANDDREDGVVVNEVHDEEQPARNVEGQPARDEEAISDWEVTTSESEEDAEVMSSESEEDAEDQRARLHEEIANMTAEQKEQYLKQSLKEWASSGGVLSMRKVDELLRKLWFVFQSVPKSYKTLLDTTRTVQLNVAGDHKMWYKGMKSNFDQMILDDYVRVHGHIAVDINMDGLPLTKDSSSSKKFWPILGRLVNTDDDPFIIAIYCGKSDPRDVDLFLGDFVVEVIDLTQNGYKHNGVNVPVIINNFILDAPARSLIKCCIGHGGYGACEKCCVVGEYSEGRIHFANVPANCRQRTDQSYRDQSDRLHHVGRSPLEFANFGMVSQFRLDTMHLVYKGVFLRLLEAIFVWEGDWNPAAATVRDMSALLLGLVQSCPRDFNCKPRKMENYFKYKATELRRLLLYDGVVVFKDKLTDEIYSLFLLLHCAIVILSCSYLLRTLADHARQLIHHFVQYSVEIFGLHFVVYNVHSLLHLTDECVGYGNLESFSAFVFENMLKTIKQTLRSGYQPLEQIVKRDSERTMKRAVKMKQQENTVQLFQPIQGNQFKRICFVLLRFRVPDDDDPNETVEVLEIGRREWLSVNDEGGFQCLWPPNCADPKKLKVFVTKSGAADSTWETHECEVISAYSQYLDAHIGLKKCLEDAAYDTEKDLGRGLRRKKSKRALTDSEEEGPPIKQSTNLPQRPKISLPVGNKPSRRIKTSPIKVVPSSSRNKNTLDTFKRIVRKDRGSTASNFEEFKKVLQKKKAEATSAAEKSKEINRNVRNVVATSPAWKASTTEEEMNTTVEVDDEDLDLSAVSSPSRLLERSDALLGQSTPLKLKKVRRDLFSEDLFDEDMTEDHSCSSPMRTQPISVASPHTKKGKAGSNKALHSSNATCSEDVGSSSLSKETPHSSNFERSALILLSEINQKVEIISGNQTKLNLHLIPNEKVLSKPDNMPTVPLKSSAELWEMEKALSDDDRISILSTYLSTFVSKDATKEKNSAKKVMSALMSNSVAKDFSLRGLKGKKSFEDLKLWTAVKGAIILKIETDLTETEQSVGKWLADAGWRKQSDGTDSKQKKRSPHKSSKTSGKSSEQPPQKSIKRKS